MVSTELEGGAQCCVAMDSTNNEVTVKLCMLLTPIPALKGCPVIIQVSQRVTPIARAWLDPSFVCVRREDLERRCTSCFAASCRFGSRQIPR